MHQDDIRVDENLESIRSDSDPSSEEKAADQFEGVDEDDPETYVNNEEKKTQLEFERQERNMEGKDKDDGVNALRYQDKIAVSSEVFKDYVRIIISHGVKNVPFTHICLSCWCLISSSDRGKHKRVGH